MLSQTFSGRIFIISSLLFSAFIYSFLVKYKFNNYIEEGSGPIVSSMPAFEFEEVLSGAKLNTESFTKSVSPTRGVVVHFWGTWCAPCEAEFPELLKLFKDTDGALTVLLLAINDDRVAIKKFLNRFGELPKGVIIGLDNSNTAADLLGTQRVPETFLFDSNGRFLNKYVGPQEWQLPKYIQDLENYFSLSINR
jgi:cytochrome c biogenesis protein CcmG/thiol:disulfide interchange protein DsbE